jgi:uncharacterized membrane protein HdeD (DUF308 family)
MWSSSDLPDAVGAAPAPERAEEESMSTTIQQQGTTRAEGADIQRYTSWRWWSIALRGVAAIIFGLIALYAPTTALLSLVIVFGVYALIDGGLALSLAARGTGISQSAIIFRGLASIVAGVLALAWPGITAFVLLLVIAAWAIVSGILEIFVAIRHRKELQHEWLLGLEGALSVGFGILLLVSPVAGAIALGLWLGIYALVFGVVLVAAGLRLRSRLRHPSPELAPA